MTREGILCGEVHNRPPQDQRGRTCPFCGYHLSSLGAFNGFMVTQPIQPDVDLLMEELSNFEGKRVLVLIVEVLADKGPIPEKTMEVAVEDGKGCLDWYRGLIKGGDFHWFNHKKPKKSSKGGR